MNEKPKRKLGWRILRRGLIGLAMFATLTAIFYTEENWRGKRAWENCKRELEAKGAALDWNKFIPPPVPDDQNFFTYSTNILLRFVKQQTAEGGDAAAKLQWLRLLNYFTSDSNSFPILDFAKSNQPVVAKISFTTTKNDLAIRFDDPAARGKIQDLIRTTLGRSANGAAGFKFCELPLDRFSPVKIELQSSESVSIRDLENAIPPDLTTNIGQLAVTATVDPKIFQVKLISGRITPAADYLKWSDQYVSAFDEIREALKRPCAIIPGDYSKPWEQPIPNFVTLRAVAQTLAQRTQCYLLLGQPEKALRELTLIHDVCRILEKPPTGQPETLVEAMINVAITGVYVSTVQDGFRLHAWQEPQLATIQAQLAEVNLPPWVVVAFQMELAASVQTYESTPAERIADLFALGQVVSNNRETKTSTFRRRLNSPIYLFLKLAPRGWWYQNLVNCVGIKAKSSDGFDLANGTISPRTFDQALRDENQFFEHWSPFKLLAAFSIPNYTKATQTTAYTQTLANEAQIACALERYRLAHGNYPETLDELSPQFIAQVPHDIIGGQPLHYRRTDDGKFLLYSVGWNETDDGGEPGTLTDVKKGDWVWQYPKNE